MTIVYAVALAVFGALMALHMIQRHARLLQQAEHRAKLSFQEAENTRSLFAAEERKALQDGQRLGEIELEIAKKQRLEQEKVIQQSKLAQSVIDAFGSYRGEQLMKGHSLEVGGLLEAVRRQLEGLPPDAAAIMAANSRTQREENEDEA